MRNVLALARPELPPRFTCRSGMSHCNVFTHCAGLSHHCDFTRRGGMCYLLCLRPRDGMSHYCEFSMLVSFSVVGPGINSAHMRARVELLDAHFRIVKSFATAVAARYAFPASLLAAPTLS